jgi:hypothetical protein
VTVRSTYRRDVAGLLSSGSDHPSAFSFGKLISAATVPALGSVSVTVPVRCTATEPGDYELTATFEPDDEAAPAADTRQIRVLEHRAATVASSFAPAAHLVPSRQLGTRPIAIYVTSTMATTGVRHSRRAGT